MTLKLNEGYPMQLILHVNEILCEQKLLCVAKPLYPRSFVNKAD